MWPHNSVHFCSGVTLPPALAILEESWWELDLLRFWFFRLLAALTDRRSTSLALKKATMNGCFDWGPCLPTRPADLTLILRPRTQCTITRFMKNKIKFTWYEWILRVLWGKSFKTLSESFLFRPNIFINIVSLQLQTIIHAWFCILHHSSTTKHPRAASTNRVLRPGSQQYCTWEGWLPSAWKCPHWVTISKIWAMGSSVLSSL